MPSAPLAACDPLNFAEHRSHPLFSCRSFLCFSIPDVKGFIDFVAKNMRLVFEIFAVFFTHALFEKEAKSQKGKQHFHQKFLSPESEKHSDHAPSCSYVTTITISLTGDGVNPDPVNLECFTFVNNYS